MATPYPNPLPSMVRFGGVGGFFSCPSAQVRKCRPAPSFFTCRQTLMPEFDQPPLYTETSQVICCLHCGLLIHSLAHSLAEVPKFRHRYSPPRYWDLF